MNWQKPYNSVWLRCSFGDAVITVNFECLFDLTVVSGPIDFEFDLLMRGNLQIAFRALTETLLAQRSAADQKIDGFTEKQRFFLSYAQLSCENRTFFSARQSMSADPHSIGRVRVSITLQNIEEFGRAFHCGKGKPMCPENSCRVW